MNGISLKDIKKTFGAQQMPVIDGVSLTIDEGEFVALTGRSGSGKSTLLYIMSTLDKPSSGSVSFDNVDTAKMNAATLHGFRNQKIGFVFQFHYLLPELTALENVLMPARKTNQHEKKQPRAEQLLAGFELGQKLHRLSGQLSGGEQQRVAIARALIMEPSYLFADEPTGNLDSSNGTMVMNILNEINIEKNMTIVLVTHDPEFARRARRQVVLADGRVVADERLKAR